jgi:transcriptional regulator EpsA
MHNYNKSLMPYQTSAFIEVVDATLCITRREQFFSWLQAQCQYLFPHEVLICGVQSGIDQEFQFERFVSTRYLTDKHFLEAINNDGIIARVIESWRHIRRPTFLAEDMQPGDYGAYVVPFAEPAGALNAIELRNIAAHGLINRDGSVSSFFCFSRVPGDLTANHAYLLELLVPHLHSVLIRVMGSTGTLVAPGELANPITERELVILQWLHKGKTNWEIAGILEISPLTVKNHVQSILRKLNVQNRSHAAAKASQMGLVRA